ncbi:ABC transporter permease [Agrobacterium vitis]
MAGVKMIGLRIGRSPIVRSILARVASGVVTLFVISIAIYGAMELMPGDIAREVLQTQATDQAIAAFREQLGLDRPFAERYLAWLGGAIQGDLGKSLVSNVPVTSLIGERTLNSLFLAGLAALMSIPLALLLGVLSAIFRNSLFDRLTGFISLTFVSLPEYALGYLLIFVFAVKFGVFPSLSAIDPAMPFLTRVHQTLLPAIALTLLVQAHMSRMTRASLISLFRRPYIEMAALKGLSRSEVVIKHALPNALGPIAVVVTLNAAYLITGIVVVEAVFAYPGLGQLMVDAVAKRDITLVQAASLIFATVYVCLNTLADLVGVITNPRLLHSKN